MKIKYTLQPSPLIRTGLSVMIKEVLPISVVVLYTRASFGTPDSDIIIEVSLFQSVLIIEGFHCSV